MLSSVSCRHALPSYLPMVIIVSGYLNWRIRLVVIMKKHLVENDGRGAFVSWTDY